MNAYIGVIYIGSSLAVILLILSEILFKKIKSENIELWIKIGSPSIIHNNNLNSAWKFWRWLFFSFDSKDSLSSFAKILINTVKYGTFLYIGIFGYLLIEFLLQ